MKRCYIVEFRCNPKYEKELISEICGLIDEFRDRNRYDGNNMACVKICDPKDKNI